MPDVNLSYEIPMNKKKKNKIKLIYNTTGELFFNANINSVRGENLRYNIKQMFFLQQTFKTGCLNFLNK